VGRERNLRRQFRGGHDCGDRPGQRFLHGAREPANDESGDDSRDRRRHDSRGDDHHRQQCDGERVACQRVHRQRAARDAERRATAAEAKILRAEAKTEDIAEAFLNDPYDWDGPKPTLVCATESDMDAALTMQILKGLAGTPTGLEPGVAGAFLGDTAASVYSGTPSITSAGSAVGAGVGPNFAVTTKTWWVFSSRARVRAPS